MKRLKYIAILSIVLFYIIQFCFVFSGSLIDNFQEIKYQKQISKLHLSTTKQISLATWNSFDNKNEIKINTVFYDVVSFKIVDKIVILKVVADNFENEMRISFESLFHKSKKSLPNQKKSLPSFHFITTISKIDAPELVMKIDNYILNNYFTITQKTKKVILKLDKPPC